MQEEYRPITQRYVLPMTSYLVELGKIGERWALRIFRGRTEIATTPLTTDLNYNEIVNVVQINVSLPMFSPERMLGTIGRLVQEARVKEAARMERESAGE